MLFSGFSSPLRPMTNVTATYHSNNCLDSVGTNSITITLSFFSQLTDKNAAEVFYVEDNTISDLVAVLVVTPLITNFCKSSISNPHHHSEVKPLHKTGFSKLPYAVMQIFKFLGAITNKLFVSQHVRTVVNSCAQIMHAIRILWSCGMDDAQLQLVYHAVVVAKLAYASSSWWGFTTASDRQRLGRFSASRLSAKPVLYWQTLYNSNSRRSWWKPFQ